MTFDQWWEGSTYSEIFELSGDPDGDATSRIAKIVAKDAWDAAVAALAKVDWE